MVSQSADSGGPRKVDGREQRGERTARALIDAARGAFADRGYSGASVREVAREADANPALVRYHFGSKEGLYYRVIDEQMDLMKRNLSEAFNVGETIEERLGNLLSAYVMHVIKHPDFPKLTLRACLDEDEGALHIAKTHLKPLYESFKHLTGIVEPNRLGSLLDVSLTVFASALMPFLYAPLLNAVFDEDYLSEERISAREEHIRTLLALMLAQYRGSD